MEIEPLVALEEELPAAPGGLGRGLARLPGGDVGGEKGLPSTIVRAGHSPVACE